MPTQCLGVSNDQAAHLDLAKPSAATSFAKRLQVLGSTPSAVGLASKREVVGVRGRLHVQPEPRQFRRHMGMGRIILRDSSSHPDFITACLLASFIFFIEPLLPIRWSKQIHAFRKEAGWIMVDGTLSWVAYALGMLPIISANSDWWGGGLVFLLGALLLLAMPVKTTIGVCKAYK